MAKIVKIINNTNSLITILGNVIDIGTYIIVSSDEANKLSVDANTFDLISKGNITINDGTSDLLPVDGYQYLSGSNLNVSVTQTSEIGKKKIWVHQSAKPEIPGKQYYTVWSGAGDDLVARKIGDGTPTQLNVLSTDVDAAVDIHFCFEFGNVFIHESYAMWSGASWGDSFSALIIAKETVLQTTVDLNYELDGVKVKQAVGGLGTGTHGFTGTPTLVPNPTLTGYWNYDSVSGLTPNVSKLGRFDIYTIEIPVNRFINKLPILGVSDKPFRINSSDTFKVPYNYFVRIIAHNKSATNWKLALFMTMYRENTL